MRPQMPLRAWRRVALPLLLAASAPDLSLAQGTLSTQGLGYPPGQLSTSAGSMGGAIGEIDPFSPLNPAAIGLATTPIVFLQAEPEYRALRIGSDLLRSSVTRFPVFLGVMPLGESWAASVSASTLLDRTWLTTRADTQFVGPDTLAGTLTSRSDGSIADVRLALSYELAPWLHVGLGAHAYSGRDVLETIHAFTDTARFADTRQQTTLSFGGNAVSVGAQGFWPLIGTVGVSYRRGGSLRTYDGNTVVRSGSVPDHLGIAAAYLGIRGTTLALRAARDSWSATRALSPSMNVHEAWDIGVGADVTGPRLGSSPLALRVGARFRTLPFSASPSPVKERTVSGGIGLPLAGGRVELHLGVFRANRVSAGVSENAWTISSGFGVRP